MIFIPRQSPNFSLPISSSFPTSSASAALQSGSQRRAAASQSDSGSSASVAPSSNASAFQPSSSGSASEPNSSASAPASPSHSSSPQPHSSSSNVAPSSSSAIIPSSSSASSAAPSSVSSAPPSSSSAGPSSVSSSPPSSSQEISSAPDSLSDSATLTSAASASTLTTITSVLADGETTTFVSAVPTSLSTAGPALTSARRTAIIAGATAAGVGLILLLLGAVFVYRRHKGRKLEFFEAIGRVRREAQGAGGAGLLDDEGFDDDDGVPMRRYRDNAVTPTDAHSRSTSTLGPPQSPTPSILRQRAETGSLFREEGVWPPPQANHFVDPLVGVGASEGLSRIVDDVMGPNTVQQHPTTTDIPSMSSASSSLYADPFRDISRHSRPPSDPSMYYDRRDASASSNGSTGSTGSRPATPQSLLGLPAGAAQAPKKSSPLANPSPPSPSPPSPTPWLNRSPKKAAASPLHDR